MAWATQAVGYPALRKILKCGKGKDLFSGRCARNCVTPDGDNQVLKLPPELNQSEKQIRSAITSLWELSATRLTSPNDTG